MECVLEAHSVRAYVRGLPVQILATCADGVIAVVGHCFSISDEPSVPEVPHPREFNHGFHEAFVAKHFGKYALLCLMEKSAWIVPDSAACLSIFHCAARGRAASSPRLVAQGEPVRDGKWLEVFAKVRRETGLWYPLGLTGIETVKLLLPNHILRLGDPEHRRYRFGLGQPASPLQGTGTPGQVAHALRNAVAALKRLSPVALPLTAGQDSRALYAALQASNCRTEPFLNYDHGVTSPVDRDTAAGLAESSADPLHSDLPTHGVGVEMPGFGGEIGRGFYYHLGKIPCRLAPAFIAVRVGVESIPESIAVMDAWLEPLSHLQANLILDLLYLEHRVGTTMSPVLAIRGADGIPAIAPFLAPSVIDGMLSLSRRAKQRGDLGKIIVAKLARRLSRFPYNRSLPEFGDLLDNLRLGNFGVLWDADYGPLGMKALGRGVSNLPRFLRAWLVLLRNRLRG